MTHQNAELRLQGLLEKAKMHSVEIGIVLFSWFFFLLGLHWKHRFGYDESHYVPTAANFLKLEGMRNLEHPPLAKELIAIGLAIFGDNPNGWRFSSTIAGAATVAGIMHWASALFKNRIMTIQAGFIALFSCIIYVQARCGILDTFMAAFLVWTGSFYTRFLNADTVSSAKKYLILTSVFLGLTTACKWFGLITGFGFFCLSTAFYVFRNTTLRSKFLANVETPKTNLLPYWKFAFWFFAPASIIYFFTFLPYLFFTDGKSSVVELFTMQKDMLNHLNAVGKKHGYESHWTTWPLMRKPVCYFYSPKEDGIVKAVFSLVNPIIQWGGLVSLGVLVVRQFKEKKLNSLLILAFYSMFYFCWMFLTRRLSFFYYYYPAALILIFALLAAAQNLPKTRWWIVGITACVFVFYFPILSAIPFPNSWIKHWLWFRVR